MVHGFTQRRFTARLVVIVRLAALVALVGATAAPGTQATAAVSQPDLLTATSFAVLAATTVTNTGPTVIGPPVSAPFLGGDLGVSPGAAVVGFPPGSVLAPGTIHTADAVALQAQTDLVTAYNTLAGETPCTALPATVGTLTLKPGVYCFTSSALFKMPSKGLTLDLQGDPNALFVFKITSQLTTLSGYPVNYINGSAPCNVWWQVGSSATLGTSTQFVGNILALTSISLDTGATLLPGRALARNGAVTLDTNRINMVGCPARQPRPTRTPGPQSTSIPASAPETGATAIISGPVGTPIPPSSLPLTGYPPAEQPANRPDNQLPTAVFAGGLLLLAAGGIWTFRRSRKLR